MCAPAPLAWHRNSESIGAAKVKNMRIVNMMRRAKRKFVWVLALLGVCLEQAQPSVADSPALSFASTLTSEFASNLRRLNPGYWADKYFGFHGEDEQIAYREGLVARSDSLMRRQHEATFGLSENPCVAGALQTFVDMPYTAIWGEDLGGEEVSWSQRAGVVGGTVLSVAGAPRVLSNVTARRAAVRAVTTQAEGGIRYPTVTPAKLQGLQPPTIEMEVASDGVARRVWPSARAHPGPRAVANASKTQAAGANPITVEGIEYIPAENLKEELFIKEAISHVPSDVGMKMEGVPLNGGKYQNFCGYGNCKRTSFGKADIVAQATGTNPSEWCGISYIGEGYINVPVRQSVLEYHFFYHPPTKTAVLHYFKVRSYFDLDVNLTKHDLPGPHRCGWRWMSPPS